MVLNEPRESDSSARFHACGIQVSIDAVAQDQPRFDFRKLFNSTDDESSLNSRFSSGRRFNPFGIVTHP
jgi:hypothetical protein